MRWCRHSSTKIKFEGYNHLVPAILINTVDLALAFYDAESDVLIMSSHCHGGKEMS